MSTLPAAAAAAQRIRAIKSSGVIVHLEPVEFSALLGRTERPLVVFAEGGIFRTNYQYLTSWRGLAFYTKSASTLALPQDAEIVNARSISVPD